MKKIIILYILLTNILLFGQNQESLTPLSDIEIHTYYVNGEVRIRWGIADMDLWAQAVEKGITLKRTTIVANGLELTAEEKLQSQVVLVERLKPLSEEEFDTQFTNNQSAENAKNLLYNPDINDTKKPSDEVKLVDAVLALEKKELQHVYTLMTAEMDFEVACATAMGYLDQTVEPNAKYIYSISLSQQKETNFRVIDHNDFEQSWGIWNDGGVDSWHYLNKYPKSGSRTLYFKNGGSDVFASTPNLLLQGSDELKIEFSLFPLSLEDGKSFEFLISHDGGASFSSIKIFTENVDFNTNVRSELSFVHLSNQLNNQTQLKIILDNGSQSDYLFVDDLIISKKSSSESTFTIVDENDFESGPGIWIPGGSQCYVRNDNWANTGVRSLAIRNGSSTSLSYTNALDLENNKWAKISFVYYLYYLTNGESFELQVSNDGGSTYEVLQSWVVGQDDLKLTEWVAESVYIPEQYLTASTQFKFQLNGSSSSDRINIDDISISVAKDETSTEDLNHNPSLESNRIDNFNTFEEGWGIWNDGGSNNWLYNTYYQNSGVHCVQLRNGTTTSNTYTNTLDLSAYQSLRLAFSCRVYSFDVGDKMLIELSTDDGQNYTVLEELVCGTDFQNNSRINPIIDAGNLTLTSQSKLRISNASDSAWDYLYIDDVDITAFVDPDFTNSYHIDFNDFEIGWGIWNDAGSDATMRTYEHVYTGKRAVISRNGTSTSFFESDPLFLEGNERLEVSFTAYFHSMETDDAFELQLSTDDGIEWKTVKVWFAGQGGIPNDGRIFDNVSIPKPYMVDGMKLRFRNYGNETNDQVYYDDIRIRSFGPEVENSSIVATDNSHQLIAPTIINAVPGDSVVLVSWEVSNDSEYTFFDIERSQDGVSWMKVNESPYIFASTANVETNEAIYKDSIPNNDTEFIYRVCGKSSYGITSPPSDTIHAQGKYPKLEFDFKIDDHVYDETNENVTINWTAQVANVESQISGYSIFRGNSPGEYFEKLNTDLLFNTTYSYTDINPKSSAYYKVVAEDVNGYTYESLLKMVQLPDENPPAIPELIDAVVVSDYSIKLTWNKVLDDDLFGYRVYTANSYDGNYSQYTSQPVKGEEMYIDLGTNVEMDSIYIKMSSVDKRRNVSGRSSALAVSRPDLYAPSSPVISKVAPGVDGINVSFVYSSSADVDKHVLQRRASNAPTWIDLLEIDNSEKLNYPTGNLQVSFVDSFYEAIQEYEYRFLAYDSAFNASGSQPARAAPYIKQVKGDVSSVDIDLETTTNARNPELDEQLKNLRDHGYNVNLLKNLGPGKDHKIKIDWAYTLDPNLLEFKVYRAMTGGRMSLYRTVSLGEALGFPGSQIEIDRSLGIKDFSFVDDELMINRRYTYDIKAVHKDGSVSNRSTRVSTLIPAN